MDLPANPNCHRTNSETITWIKETLNNGKVSQDYTKEKAILFFGNHIKDMNKRSIYNKIVTYI